MNDNLGEQFLHQKLNEHLQNIGKTTRTLPEDIDSFAAPLSDVKTSKEVAKATILGMPHISNATASIKQAIQAHKDQKYLIAGKHLSDYGNHWIKVANIWTNSFPDTPIAMSFSSRIQNMQEHIAKYNQLATENYT